MTEPEPVIEWTPTTESESDLRSILVKSRLPKRIKYSVTFNEYVEYSGESMSIQLNNIYCYVARKKLELENDVSGPLLKVHGKINNVDAMFLLDSGAENTIMSYSLYSKLDKPELNLISDPWFVSGSTGPPLKVLGSLKSNIVVAGIEFKDLDIWVINDDIPKHDLMLGLPFLLSNKVKLNNCNESFTCHLPESGSIEIFLNDANVIDLNVAGIDALMSNDSELTNCSLLPISFGINFEYFSYICPDKSLYFESNESLEFEYGIKIESGILNKDNLSVLVYPGNNEIIYLTKDTKLGSIYSIDSLCKESRTSIIEYECDTIVDVSHINETYNLPAHESQWSYDNLSSKLELDENLLDNVNLKTFHDLAFSFKNIFAQGDWDINISKLAPYTIKTVPHEPVYIKPRRFPPRISEMLQKEIQGLYDKGLIEPSQSPYNSPCLPLIKKDNSIRLCLDYREVNKVIEPD